MTTDIKYLLFSALLSIIIGAEREAHGREAGIRTHLLVGIGSTLIMLLSQKLTGADPARLAAQVISGIGFLGAGTILKERGSVKGLTTAACIWATACIGLAVGMGQIELAIVCTAIVALGGMTIRKLCETVGIK